jgi:streptogramin lyase
MMRVTQVRGVPLLLPLAVLLVGCLALQASTSSWPVGWRQNSVATSARSGRADVQGTLAAGGNSPQVVPWGITAGPDGNVWFTESRGNAIGRISPTGVIRSYPLPTPRSAPRGITLGSDGNLWFAEPGSLHIGRISPDGQIKEFPVPAAAPPCDIARSRDGTVWFTGCSRDVIGRLSSSGEERVYTLPAESELFGIAAGPDGAMWFTVRSGIGRIAPDGQITYVKLQPYPGQPLGITTGPDGAMWFTVTSGLYDEPIPGRSDWIGRITMQGAVKLFDVGSYDASWMYDIAADADHHLWVPLSKSSSIGKMTPGGKFTVYPLPGFRVPMWITAGPDGNVWFTDPYGDLVGKITPSGEVTEYLIPPPAK